MKKKYIIGLFIIVGMLNLYGCGVEEQNAETNVSVEEKHVHGEEGYFSLIDEGFGTTVKSQVGGTCWVNAASTSMESSYKRMNGETIDIDPMEILNSVHGGNKREGYFIKEGINGTELGGWAWQITETLSNGFGEYVLVESADYSAATIDEMKEAIRNYGGMNVAVNDNTLKKGFNGGYMTMNDPDSDYFDHEVVLVGWDDNFPKEYFKKEASQDGAWLAQNSLSEAWGNDGYYWISYDTPFREQTVFVLSKQYASVLSYDGGKENSIQTGLETVVGNVFHKEGKLAAIGTYTTKEEQDITIEIRDVNMKEVIYTQEVCFETPGYHVVPLNEKLDVSEYAVVIHYKGAAPVEGESWSDTFLDYSVGANSGESYVLIDGKWKDLSDADISEVLGVDFIPNNCCIKALYVE